MLVMRHKTLYHGLTPWRQRQYLLPKCWYPITRFKHRIVTKSSTTLTFTAVKISNFEGPINLQSGRAIAQAVNRRLPTSSAPVPAQVRSCGICGGQCGTGVGFLRVLRFPLPILIPLTAAHSSSIIRGWYKRSNSGRRTKWTQSRPTPRQQETTNNQRSWHGLLDVNNRGPTSGTHNRSWGFFISEPEIGRLQSEDVYIFERISFWRLIHKIISTSDGGSVWDPTSSMTTGLFHCIIRLAETWLQKKWNA
jgi:hypothetical protein